MKKLILIISLALNFLSCQYSPGADKYTTSKPEIEDVIGVYEFDSQTVDYGLEEEEFKGHKSIILIKPDSTFVIQKIPLFNKFRILKHKYENPISSSGKWSLETVSSVENHDGSIDKHWGLTLDSVPEELRKAGLLGKDNVTGIIFKYGDPDEGDVMIFNKK